MELAWGQARGKAKDKEHALTIEKMTNRDGATPRLLKKAVASLLMSSKESSRECSSSEPVKNGDVVMFVMPQGVHMDVLGSAVRGDLRAWPRAALSSRCKVL